ncbi:cell division inhibitor SulA [Sinobacterium caligoides]|uniref:Cell division inhibitor SulA n=1 Tax=Sinobacterium caligoides TaxID=933926 RepID=A0A3N2DKK6_9GAMM|nr:SulA-like leucine-rich domain-containing protein [Sinobacterium caligoides]ROS00308.1 cell division inhibitor SulA [Sinobacterium caligoides]
MPLFAALENQETQAGYTECITELAIKGKHCQELLLLPIISHLSSSDDSRWVTWINPPPLNRSKLKEFGLDQRPILIINTKSQAETNALLLRCLNNGRSNTVIANIEDDSALDRRQLCYAANNGNSHCLLVL